MSLIASPKRRGSEPGEGKRGAGDRSARARLVEWLVPPFARIYRPEPGCPLCVIQPAGIKGFPPPRAGIPLVHALEVSNMILGKT
jgi:hypothetical protein